MQTIKIQQQTLELWKDIKNWEGIYRISNMGRVKSLTTNTIRTHNINNSGYCCVTLKCKGKKTQTVTIHRLVAQHFLPNPYNKSDVNHIDENKMNNKVDNLEWLSHKENCQYGNRNKLVGEKLKGRTGEQSCRSIRVYCIELDMIFPNSRIASEYVGIVGGSHITACCRGNRKTAGGYHWRYAKD